MVCACDIHVHVHACSQQIHVSLRYEYLDWFSGYTVGRLAWGRARNTPNPPNGRLQMGGANSSKDLGLGLFLREVNPLVHVGYPTPGRGRGLGLGKGLRPDPPHMSQVGKK